MRLSVAFKEEESSFPVKFEAQAETLPADFGEVKVISGGVQSFRVDETLSFVDGLLSVNTAHEPDPDNTLPITSAAVAATVGNIEILLTKI